MGDHPILTCQTCIDYAESRRDALAPAVMRQAAAEGETPPEVLLRFIQRVHDRHEAGLPLVGAS